MATTTVKVKNSEVEVVGPPSWKYQRWLPYWAVLQTDLRQTVRSWAWRLWVIVVSAAAVGFLMYHFGVHRQAGINQDASEHSSDLMRGIVLGSLALIVVLTVSAISSERGTLADSVLSRGISRYQYFLAKWHSRSIIILATFAALAALALTCNHFLLSENMSFTGGLMAIVTICAVLWAIISVGVTIGAMTGSTVLGITMFWIVLYGCGFLMSLLPSHYPSPGQMFSRLPNVLQGKYSTDAVAEFIIISTAVSLVSGTAGLLTFARKDV